MEAAPQAIQGWNLVEEALKKDMPNKRQ